MKQKGREKRKGWKEDEKKRKRQGEDKNMIVIAGRSLPAH